MKTTNTIIAITIILLAVIACKKAPELEEHKYHELIEGRMVYFYFYHNAGFQYHWDTDAKGIKNFIKKEKNIYSLVDSFNRILKIDSIILNPNNDQVTISKLTDIYAFKDPHYEIYFKNARTISEDSIVGEFYDAFVYSSPNRIWLPTYGEFAMKIKK
jgi:hypothetical protein